MEWIYVLVITLTIMEPIECPDRKNPGSRYYISTESNGGISCDVLHFGKVAERILPNIYSLDKGALMGIKLKGTYQWGTEISYKIDSTDFKDWAKQID